MRFRVLTYNVHKFFNITNRRYILGELKKRLIDLNLDVVFIQEMRGLHPEKYRSEFSLDPLEHLADQIWSHFVYGKNAVYSDGHHGNAILSKFPFKSWENLDISTNAFERRSLLLGTVEGVGQEIVLACTHLDLTERGRRQQQQRLIEKLSGFSSSQVPVLLGGDFNDWNGRTRAYLCENGFNDCFPDHHAPEASSFPSFMPVLPLDKIFYANSRCVNVQVLEDPHWQKLSDHLPILAEFIF